MQVAALRLLRLHVMDSVRLRLEAGHRDFISELRHCTMLFVGFPSLRVLPPSILGPCSCLPATSFRAPACNAV